MGSGSQIPPSFLFVIAFLLSSALGVSGQQYPINVWPKPTTFLWPKPQVTLLSPNLVIELPDDKHLINYVQFTFFKLQFNESYNPLVEAPLNLTSAPPLRRLFIKVADPNATLAHGVNESYTLSIPAPYGSEPINATMTAQTIWGAMRGLETFSQLIYGNPARVACGLYIRDEPLFKHRGVMLDTSRNYYGVKELKRLIRAMSMNKLNVFHWHITDSQSFPLVLPSEPQLAEKGAYGKKMKNTPNDVKKVVEFGLNHGVRVVPEIEMPAHTGSWAAAFPDIVTCENKFWWDAGRPATDRFANEPGTGQLNPLNPKTYKVVENVIRDVAAMFPDSFFHAGADEINSNCWKSDPAIQAFLANNGTLSQVLEIFVNSTLPAILSQNRTVVYWEDVILDESINVSLSLLPRENVILQAWTDWRNSTKKIVSAGFQTIVSSMDFYYLDRGHGTFLGNYSQYNMPPWSESEGTWYPPFITWQTMYNYDITYGLNEEEAKLVLGGEVALWSEQADATVMDSQIWPRTSAMAEALWSGNKDQTGMKRFAEATDRLNEWRNRMVHRGIGAEPIQPLWCVKNPGMCNMVN